MISTVYIATIVFAAFAPTATLWGWKVIAATLVVLAAYLLLAEAELAVRAPHAD